MKKSVKIYSLAVAVLLVVFTLIYYISYKNTVEKYNLELREKESNAVETDSGMNEGVEANMENSLHVSRKMTYISELYDSVTNTVSQAVDTIPDEWIGLSRNELIQKLSESEDKMTLVSFSEDRLVVRESRMPVENDYSYYMTVTEGVLVVYYADMHDVYLNTYLTLDELPEEDREMLTNGFYISNITELYDYLESITS